MKRVKILIGGFIFLCITTIIWMNITPGYFQVKNDVCTYEVLYIKDKENQPSDSSGSIPLCYKYEPPLSSWEGLFNKVKLLLATIDFNR